MLDSTPCLPRPEVLTMAGPACPARGNARSPVVVFGGFGARAYPRAARRPLDSTAPSPHTNVWESVNAVVKGTVKKEVAGRVFFSLLGAYKQSMTQPVDEEHVATSVLLTTEHTEYTAQRSRNQLGILDRINRIDRIAALRSVRTPGRRPRNPVDPVNPVQETRS